jgi:endoglucanase Acf2
MLLFCIAAHRDRLYFLARDVGNPSHRDPDFPVVRHQDYYYGFSWASGVAPGERQEESASEVKWLPHHFMFFFFFFYYNWSIVSIGPNV